MRKVLLLNQNAQLNCQNVERFTHILHEYQDLFIELFPRTYE
jgi:hypothetical protein